MKRTRAINLESMRKNKRRFCLKPLVISMAAIAMGCSQKQETLLVKSTAECQQKTSLNAQQCKAAYQEALAEAERTGPRYSRESYCEEEFGRDQCTRGNHGYFVPLMTGFLVATAINNIGSNYYHPAYTYRGPLQRDRLILSDGTVLGKSGSRTYDVSDSKLKSKMPKATRTVSRGGFGSKASARSSWGGGSRSGGWGG